MIDPVLAHTFCSKVAATIVIADHLRHISGDSRLAVCSTKLSIQDLHRRRPGPFIAGLVALESVWVCFTEIAPVPSCFTAIRNHQCPAVFKWDGMLELLKDLWDNFIFFLLWILNEDRVVVLHQELAVISLDRLEAFLG